ncbi:MAG TPA: GNAT family N-acetyltransferase [Polyangiaceae bacterium]|nr:GNAT family N-acetyltransferase [Polyangiaceae bacterium]
MTLAFPLLAQHPELVPLVAKWIFDEWGHERPGTSLEALKLDIASKLDPTTLPVQVLAVADDVPLGVAILKPHEMRDIFPDRSPWLGSLVVDPVHRRKGIGTALAREVEALASSRGFTRLYLQTELADGGLYARLGWHTCDRLPYRSYQANVMFKELRPMADK